MRPGVVGILGIAAIVLAAAGVAGLMERGGTGPAHPPVPAPTVGAAPAPVTQPTPPSFDVVKIAPDGTAVIAGRAAPGAKVTVLDGDKPLGAVTADESGEWVLLPKAPIPPGERQLRLEATDAGGRTVKSQQSVALAIAPPKPAGGGETALAVALPQEAGGAAKLLQRPDGGAPGGGLTLDVLEYDGKGGIALSGHARPGARLEIYLANRPLAAAQADVHGEWSARVAHAAAGGGGELRLDEIGADGKVARRIAVPLVAALATNVSPGQFYVVRPGNNLWQIARHSYGSGTRYVIIYSANLSKIRDPDLIYPGQVFRLPKS